MFIPSAKSKSFLLLLALIAIALFFWVNKSRNFVQEKYFEQKLQAAQVMQQAMKVIREYRLEQGVYIDEINDPNKTSLIGDKQTLITTDRGSLTAKLTSLNPNFAALVVDLFHKAKLRKGDLVAANFTGSFPAVNIAVMCAAKVMELDLRIITSAGASMFGATDPEFTWLDMESLLIEKGIFHYKSSAASLGGGRDLGRGLNIIGRDLIETAVSRNEIDLIKGSTLEENIARKFEYFSKDNSRPALYVNVGGGLSSLGNSINGRLVSPGYHRYLNIKNIPLKGTMFLLADQGVPVVHLLDIEKLAEMYDLPRAPDPLPNPGEGTLFLSERYNLTVTTIALILLIIMILAVLIFDHTQMKLKDDEIDRS